MSSPSDPVENPDTSVQDAVNTSSDDPTGENTGGEPTDAGRDEVVPDSKKAEEGDDWKNWKIPLIFVVALSLIGIFTLSILMGFTFPKANDNKESIESLQKSLEALQKSSKEHSQSLTENEARLTETQAKTNEVQKQTAAMQVDLTKMSNTVNNSLADSDN